MEFVKTYDYMDRLRAGMFASKLISYDSTKKTYTVKNFNIRNRFFSQGHLNKQPLFTANNIARPSAIHINFPRAFETFTSFGDTTNARIVQERNSFLKMAEAQAINITVPGRCDYTVGMVVELELHKRAPVRKTDKKADILDKVNSGKYLVSAINHVIGVAGHDCTMQLIKDSMMMQVA
jgi:hypothetical protein